MGWFQAENSLVVVYSCLSTYQADNHVDPDLGSEEYRDGVTFSTRPDGSSIFPTYSVLYSVAPCSSVLIGE